MFGPVKKQMAAFFGYYKKKFNEECDVAMEVFENEEFLIDLIIGQKSSNVFGAIISQYVPGNSEDIEDEEEEISEEEEDEEEEDEEEEDEEEQIEEGFTIDYNMVRFIPQEGKGFQFAGSPACEGDINIETDLNQKMTFIVYTQPATNPDPDDPKNEVTGFLIKLNDNTDTRLYFQEDPALDELFE